MWAWSCQAHHQRFYRDGGCRVAKLPVVRDAKAAALDPELAVLSAMAHGKGDPVVATEVATAALEASGALDRERAVLYFDLIITSLGAATRLAFENLMAQGKYEFQSEFAKKYFAEGIAAGKAEGKAEGAAASVLRVLRARGLAVTAEQKLRVTGSTDTVELDRWLDRAVMISSTDELFES